MPSTDVYLATKGKGANFNRKVIFPGKEISIRKITGFPLQRQPAMRLFYVYNGNSYAGKMPFLY